MAGHSKWANIKHRKGRQDAKRSKVWSKCSRAIIVAARNGGGDPSMNLTLRYAIDDAKAENMPKDTIENAIKKGVGDVDGVNYESVIYEGYGPAGVAVMVECLTDNKNRTVPELRKLFERGGGNLGASGCVAYNFVPQGQIFLAKDKADEEKVMDVALEAGAADVADEDSHWLVVAEPSDFPAVKDALDAAGLEIDSSQLTMSPQTTVDCTGKDAQKVLNMIEGLEDHDDVQKVHANFEISEEELAALDEG